VARAEAYLVVSSLCIQPFGPCTYTNVTDRTDGQDRVTIATVAIAWLWRGFEWSADRMQILPIRCI